jgi:hypothetical protein
MKNALLLLATGGGLSLVSWAFWHYLGNDALNVLNSIILFGVVADNLQLRRQLRKSGTKV